MTTINRVFRFWGKTNRKSDLAEDFHPAIFHMLDVGFVARDLLSIHATPRWRRILANALSVPETILSEWIPWWVALHDIGKISAPFQSNSETQRARLLGEGFDLGEVVWQNTPYHALISALFVEELAACKGIPDNFTEIWRDALAGHHGQFVTRQTLLESRWRMSAEPAMWREYRLETAMMLEQALGTELPQDWPANPNLSSGTMVLNGFIVLCDWLASDENYFKITPSTNWETYQGKSTDLAKKALNSTGFQEVVISSGRFCFTELFPNLIPPRPLQLGIDEIPAELLSGPCLAIIEAPTGEGKTEAALALAHRLAQASGSDEFYYALPTMATSNQMYARLKSYLKENLVLSAAIRLVHGQAFLMTEKELINPMNNGTPTDRSAAPLWLGSDNRKAILMPFGVGTVDQAELAALNVRFTALRLVGLAGKVVILDEVHAYDTYMTSIIERLLEWLSVIGTSVILLSATLPLEKRYALLQAYQRPYIPDLKLGGKYPQISLVSQAGSHHSSPPAVQPQRRIQLRIVHDFTEEDIDAKALFLINLVSQGGCACWIANTVNRAQAIFARLDYLAGSMAPGVDRMLLHARFPLEQRLSLEEALNKKYGPGDRLAASGIVVGTQVLEQSLDLDFDVMISDLAPADLLLQRTGRLHRHAHHPRPKPHSLPSLVMNVPLNSDGNPDLSIDALIYDEYILLKTWEIMAEIGTLNLPEDYRTLVEAVYAESPPPAGHRLQAAWEQRERKREQARGEARLRLLPEPDPEWSFCSQLGRMTFEEDESRAGWIVAQTRLGEPSLTVIPLALQGDTAILYHSGEAFPINEPACWADQKRMLRWSMRLTNKDLISYLKSKMPERPLLFTESPLLSDCSPLWLGNGHAQISAAWGELRLELDPKLGLVILKQGGY